ncbi:MAG: 2,3,4,5-tetrahydropyridine-2,6-dicarboxylate N-succinyltransferase [Legionellaceae bacterium]|nr:2,3,4,5-tetrahydropyridine-2,6-dicarboxylate N-succinyltransferase [Legionellaceae bacterium]
MLEEQINHYFDIRDTLSPEKAPTDLLDALTDVFHQLDTGAIRVAEPKAAGWVVHAWVKKAILLSFKCYENEVIEGKHARFYDKLPLKFADTTAEQFKAAGVRVVPDAIARRGSFIGKNTILMPSYINVGAYVDEGTMIDTWATVGSCAQIGKHVHLSGGAGIGGVLEPLQAEPTIIEDHCFIGARSEIVEGVIVEHHSVISMGVFIGQSTKIYNRVTGEITIGRVPAGSVVVPGSLPSKDGSHSLACAVIIKQVDEKTRAKVGINDLLRDNSTC